MPTGRLNRLRPILAILPKDTGNRSHLQSKRRLQGAYGDIANPKKDPQNATGVTISSWRR